MDQSHDVKISIIVPIHNAGEHLRNCLDTLVNQSLKEIEIILVLDCPTDGSEKVVQEYADKDKRIVIVKNESNLHIGLSRNEGLKVARGEYIGFSDHDDFRELQMYEELYRDAKKSNSDIVFSGFGYVKTTGVELLPYPSEEKAIKLLLSILIGSDKDDITWHRFIRNGGIWNKIYKRSLLLDNKIIFQDNRKMTFEDLFFQIQCLSFAMKISCVNKIFYFHVEDIENTASGYSYYSYPLIVSYLQSLHDFLIQIGLYEKHKKRFHDSVVFFIITSILNEFSKKSFFKIDWLVFFKIKNELFVKESFRNVKIIDTDFRNKSTVKLILARILFSYFRSDF